MIAVFDIDGTLRRVADPWLHLHRHLGTIDQGEEFFQQFLAGEITYKQMAAMDVSTWKGVPLANRVRKILEKVEGLSEKKMFGGLCFLINGNMALGLVNEDLMIRVKPDAYEKFLSQSYVRKMDFTGKPLKGFLYVGPKGTEADKDLKKWVLKGIEFALSLPPKNKK